MNLVATALSQSIYPYQTKLLLSTISKFLHCSVITKIQRKDIVTYFEILQAILEKEISHTFHRRPSYRLRGLLTTCTEIKAHIGIASTRQPWNFKLIQKLLPFQFYLPVSVSFLHLGLDQGVSDLFSNKTRHEKLMQIMMYFKII